MIDAYLAALFTQALIWCLWVYCTLCFREISKKLDNQNKMLKLFLNDKYGSTVVVDVVDKL